jgi:hypothetical protein
MKSKILKLALLFLLIPPAFAHEEDEDPVTKEDIVFEQKLGKSPFRVQVHNQGHLEGRPFVIEITEKCSTDEVIDAASACDVALDTFKFNPRSNELSVLVREPATSAQGLSSELTCRSQAKKLIFQLRSGCGL